MLALCFLFKASPSTYIAAIVEHVIALRIKGPIGSLTGSLIIPCDLDKAIIQRQIVSDTILPPLLILAVVRKAVHDKLVDAVQGNPSVRGVLDRHGNQGDVAVWWLDHVFATAMG